MAKPILLEIPPRDPRVELRTRLENAPVEHAEALLAAYEVLQGLHDNGVLEILRGALGRATRFLRSRLRPRRPQGRSGASGICSSWLICSGPSTPRNSGPSPGQCHCR